MPANKLVDPLGAPWRSVWHAVKEWADGLHQWPRRLTGQSPPPDKRQRTVAAWAAGAILLAVAVAGLTSTVPNVPTHKAAAPTTTTTSTSTSTSTTTTPDSSTSPTSPAAPAAPASRAIPDGVLARDHRRSREPKGTRGSRRFHEYCRRHGHSGGGHRRNGADRLAQIEFQNPEDGQGPGNPDSQETACPEDPTHPVRSPVQLAPTTHIPCSGMLRCRPQDRRRLAGACEPSGTMAFEPTILTWVLSSNGSGFGAMMSWSRPSRLAVSRASSAQAMISPALVA